MVWKNNNPLCILSLYTKHNCFTLAGEDNNKIPDEDYIVLLDYLFSMRILDTNSIQIVSREDYFMINQENIKDIAPDCKNALYERIESGLNKMI